MYPSQNLSSKDSTIFLAHQKVAKLLDFASCLLQQYARIPNFKEQVLNISFKYTERFGWLLKRIVHLFGCVE